MTVPLEDDYSYRKATSGSTLVARFAGIKQASALTVATITAALAMVAGSCG